MPLEALVYSTRIFCMCGLVEFVKRISVLRNNYLVNVIVHQAVGENAYFEFLRIEFHDFQVFRTIAVVKEHDLASAPALGNVVWNSGEYFSGLSRHHGLSPRVANCYA